MRTRRSRFFVILLHLVGVSHYHSTSFYSNSSGIVAVVPYPIALEQIDLYKYVLERAEAQPHPTRHVWNRRRRKETDNEMQQQPPIWLQDPSDGLCLGPMGRFSECGDATLWFVQIKPLPLQNKLKLLSGVPESIFKPLFFGMRKNKKNSRVRSDPAEAQFGLTFRVVDRDYEVSSSAISTSFQSSASKETRRQRRKRKNQAECLDANPLDLSVDVQSCRSRAGFIWQSNVRSSVWTVRSDGILQPVASANRFTSAANHEQSEALCLTRGGTKSSDAILSRCDSVETPLQFLFLRYRTVPAVTATSAILQHQSGPLQSNTVTSSGYDAVSESNTEDAVPTFSPLLISNDTSNLPVTRDLAHSQAVDPLLHPDLKVASRLIFADQSQRKGKDVSSDATSIHKPFAFVGALSNTNPILLAASINKNGSPSPVSAKVSNHLVKDASNLKALKLRRMQTHPYLNEAVNGIWTDPQTKLQYATDLCRYLGRNRKEHGRHTLTGFGIYRKGYVIKVYGIAYYVSKRDVLADSVFEPYISMTAEELRLRPDFYEVLRKMGKSSSDRHPNEGFFDRTIMLKTNMQLSAETMRSSLEADWSYLTDEAKRTLVGASMQRQPADDNMLAFIQSPENPSRCSCSQIAPPEYNANPECCARGTELVFTWTKYNDLEVRLNGRLMDVFPRPDIAEGIFYEYLRLDNPISPEFVERVVDGFPFLLGPLAQVRGVNLGQSSHQKKLNHGNAMVRAINELREFAFSQASEMLEFANRNMLEAVEQASEHSGNMAKMFGEAAIEFAKEADRRRDLMVKHTVAAPEVFMKLLSRDEETIQYFMRWMSGQSAPLDPLEDEETTVPIRRGPRGRVFGYPLSRWFGEDLYVAPDEIGPMKIHPTINKAILTLVHLYLLLLFIVSFPGSYSTRTRLLSRKYSVREPIDDSESDTSDEQIPTLRNDDGEAEPFKESLKRHVFHGSELKRFFVPGSCQPLRTTQSVDADSHPSNSGLKKKSLSYFL
jgi:hypothetical protein